jgi:isocitrate dehydrogenase (NAD+)
MAYRVTLIPGDGIGPEVVDAAVRCIEATGVSIEWERVDAGEGAMQKEGTPLPQRTIDSLRRNRVALKGPTTTPIGTGFRSVNVALRKEFDTYANLRPCRTYAGVPSPFQGVDLVIVRENTEDLYAGIEFKQGEPVTKEVIDFLSAKSEKKIRPDSGVSIKPISITGTRRIVKFAFEYAKRHGRKKVTAVHKANIMKHTDGLFLEVARQVAAEYPGIAFDDRVVDNMCMQLVTTPQSYDVLVLPNLYGDIVSDLCAGLVGGLGVAPGGNYGEGYAIFEAVHGSAPKYAGKNLANPTAVTLSGALMLKHLGEQSAGERLERAVADVLREGRRVTYDLMPDRKGGVGTSQFADAVIERLKRA